MISPAFNSAQSNDHLQIKFDRIYEQVESKALQSIKLLRMCIDREKNHNQWTPDIARAHNEEMITILEDSYRQ